MSGRTGAIVVGAGGGRRMGGVEKAFMTVLGRPLLAYSVDTFERSAAVDTICLVVSTERVEAVGALARQAGWEKLGPIVAGGESRQDSVRAGLEAMDGVEWVLVHDAARPLVDEQLIVRGLEAARRHGAAVPVVPVRDTIKRVRPDGEARLVVATVDRTELCAAQTPQVFATRTLRDAFAAAGARAASFTDDASLVEAMGREVAAFEGCEENVKLTYPADLPVVELLLRRRGLA